MNISQQDLTIDNILNFNSVEFTEIFSNIFNDFYDEKIIENFLINLNLANLPINCFIGSIKALKKEMISIDTGFNCLDVCGTGGDKLNSLNVSTAVAFILASAGIPVAKHGNKSISSNSGSADIFQELKIKFSDNISEIKMNLSKNNLAFLYAPLFHPALKKLSSIRKKINQPTIFNYLGPLLNPTNSKLQLLGTSRFDTMEKIAQVIALDRDNHVFIVHGFDGMDEISISSKSYLQEVKNGEIFEKIIIDPVEFNFKLVDHQEIQGKDPKHNSQKLINLLDGEKSAYRDIVILNSAYGLLLANQVKNINEGISFAESLIDNHQAKLVLKSLQQ
jgi:anthranilate phosphoribosyltransferase